MIWCLCAYALQKVSVCVGGGGGGEGGRGGERE